MSSDKATKSAADFYPEGLKWNVDLPQNKTLVDMLDQTAIYYDRSPCIEFKGKKYDYGQFNMLTKVAAKGLMAQGITAGDRVGLYMPNTPYYPIMFFGALRAGATVVNFSPLYTEEELAKQVDDSGTKIMVGLDLTKYGDQNAEENMKNLLGKGALEKLVICPMENVLPTLTSIAYRLFRRDDIARHDFNNDNVIKFGSLIRSKGKFTPPKATPEDIALIQYTGGTTGIPKGAMLTHKNLVSNVNQVSEFYGYKYHRPQGGNYIHRGSEKVLSAIPFFHVFGMTISMLGSINMGNEMIIVPNPRDIEDIMKTIDKKKPTLFPSVPLLMQKISEHPDKDQYDLSSLRNVVSGGAALPPGVQKAFEAAVGKPGIIKQGYGLTETSPVACSNPPIGPNKPDTVGLPYPLTDVKIIGVDDPTKTMLQDQTGEICIKGPQVMKGYWNKPDATKEVMTNDGYFRTGDIGFIDPDGYIKITDRLKRMISINGMKVYPNIVENALSKHPDVAECIVVGINKNTNKEAAKAFIRFKDGTTKPDEDALRDFLKGHINRLEIPRFFEFCDEELPKTSVGKPDWKKLEDEEAVKAAAKISKEKNTLKPQ